MPNHRGGNHIDILRARIVAHEQPNKLSILDHGQRETGLAVLERRRQFIDEQPNVRDRIAANVDCRHQRVRHEQLAARLELPCRHVIPHPRVGDLQRLEFRQELLVYRAQQREICLVIDHIDRRRDLLTALRLFELHIGCICHQLGGHQHPAPGHHRPDRLPRVRRFLTPGPVKIVSLICYVHPHDGHLFRRRCLVGLRHRRHGEGHRHNHGREAGHGFSSRFCSFVTL